MRPFALLNVLWRRLDVTTRRVAVVLFAEKPIDENGRHHPALRSGPPSRRSGRVGARLGDRWYTLLHLFVAPRVRRSDRDVRGVALAPADPNPVDAKRPYSGRNAAA
jgi:hypothetical protein